MNVTAYLGLGSRYSYLAATQIERIEAELGVTFDWVPLNSIDLIRQSRQDGSPFDRKVLEGQYAPEFRDLDARRWAELYGVAYNAPQISDLPEEALALACWCVPRPDARRMLMQALFDALFARGEAMSIDRLTGIANEFGVSKSDMATALDGKGASELHRDAMAQALAMGVFGVPTFAVGNELYWGNDRLPLLEDHLGKIVNS